MKKGFQSLAPDPPPLFSPGLKRYTPSAFTQGKYLETPANQKPDVNFFPCSPTPLLPCPHLHRYQDSALATLQRLFGRRLPEPLDYQISRWHRDRYALGAYSFNALGSTPALGDHLGQGLAGRLFFAGEATSRQHFGTAHGAYLSGLAVAEQIRQGAA